MKPILFFFSSLILLIACVSSRQKTNTAKESHNSQKAADWVGIYRGTLPCADCEGILTTIRLKQDLTYDLSREYLGKSTGSYTQSGSFQWSRDGKSISLVSWEKEALSGEEKHSSEAQEHYLVGEDQIIKLDKDGKRIEDSLEKKYVLKKVNFDKDIREKYWRLVEVKGKLIKPVPGQTREAHLILKNSETMIKGHGGCNSFTGGYELPEGNRIRISNLAATEMACSDIDYEGDFFQALEQADNYTINGDSLSLNKARMAPLARFVVVYFR